MKKVVLSLMVLALALSLFGSGSTKATVSDDYQEQLAEMKAGNYTVDFSTAEDFEKALNS